MITKEKNRKASVAMLVCCALALATSTFAHAAEHDVSIDRLKSQNLSDLYVFREDNQTGIPADKGNLIVIMNSDPHAAAGRQDYFDPAAAYDFHFSLVSSAEKNTLPTGHSDFTLEFKFSAPDGRGHQEIQTTLYRRSGLTYEQAEVVADLLDPVSPSQPVTTTLAESKAESPNINRLRTLGGHDIEAFAGMREDPFFFDVDQFLKVRAGALGKGPKASFRPASEAVDFTKGLNVNTIVARVPIALLAGDSGSPIFDVWATVSVKDRRVERLARPAVNQGLGQANAYLCAFNMIPPGLDHAHVAAPALTGAAKTLVAFDMLDGKIDQPVSKTKMAFLPDVMRIDTRLNIPAGKTAYNADVSGSLGIFTGGRKLQDDVMDITLSLLVAGDRTGLAVKDGVSYEGAPGNRHQGHKMLEGQSRSFGPAKFPFLATPN